MPSGSSSPLGAVMDRVLIACRGTEAAAHWLIACSPKSAAVCLCNYRPNSLSHFLSLSPSLSVSQTHFPVCIPISSLFYPSFFFFLSHTLNFSLHSCHFSKSGQPTDWPRMSFLHTVCLSLLIPALSLSLQLELNTNSPCGPNVRLI